MNEYTSYSEYYNSKTKRASFIVNNGGQWDETNSRIHCCDVVYMDAHYIQRTIRKWAGSIKEACDLATAAWLAEKEAGRTA